MLAVQVCLVIGLLVGMQWVCDALRAVREIENKLPRMVYVEK